MAKSAGTSDVSFPAIIRKRLTNGSLTLGGLGGDPPVDACVKKLLAYRNSLLKEGNANEACESFCKSLDTLKFHLQQTRHLNEVIKRETEAYKKLQTTIVQLQTSAKDEIKFLKGDLKVAYQTHLNKEECEVCLFVIRSSTSHFYLTFYICANLKKYYMIVLLLC